MVLTREENSLVAIANSHHSQLWGFRASLSSFRVRAFDYNEMMNYVFENGLTTKYMTKKLVEWNPGFPYSISWNSVVLKKDFYDGLWHQPFFWRPEFSLA